MIFFLFEPLEEKKYTFDEIPLLELKNFKLTELNTQGLSSILESAVGFKYKDRYILQELSFTDSNNKYITNIQSDNALYKNNQLNLDGNVIYFKDGNIHFKTQKANYDKKTKIITSVGKYIAYIGENKAIGTSLMYNNKIQIMESKNIIVNYKVKEK